MFSCLNKRHDTSVRIKLMLTPISLFLSRVAGCQHRKELKICLTVNCRAIPSGRFRQEGNPATTSAVFAVAWCFIGAAAPLIVIVRWATLIIAFLPIVPGLFIDDRLTWLGIFTTFIDHRRLGNRRYRCSHCRKNGHRKPKRIEDLDMPMIGIGCRSQHA